MAANGAGDGRGAEKNGVRLRKVFAGIEVVELRFGLPGLEAGSELAEAGFQVGDVLTKVDNTSLLGDETGCAQVLRLVADGQDGVGRAFVEGFRRVPGFPRPARNAVSGHVARQAFSDNPTPSGDDVDSASTLVGANLDPEVAAVLSEVSAKAEFMAGPGAVAASGPAVVHDSFTSAGYGSDKNLSGGSSLYQTADSKSRDEARGSWRGRGPSDADASWDPRRSGDDEQDFGLHGTHTTHASNGSVERQLRQVRRLPGGDARALPHPFRSATANTWFRKRRVEGSRMGRKRRATQLAVCSASGMSEPRTPCPPFPAPTLRRAPLAFAFALAAVCRGTHREIRHVCHRHAAPSAPQAGFE